MTRILWLALLGAALSTGAAAQAADKPALEGLDPVLLTQGQETPGKDGMAVRYHRFLYWFSSEETRARFQKEPDRYSIQLDGACARMGAPVEGSPDAYFVYDHRIYVFGSSDCYKRFSANPRKYLAEAHPKPDWNPTAETRRHGKAVLGKTIAVMGGPEKLDAIQSYAETRQVHSPRGDATSRISVKLPDSFTTENIQGGRSSGSLVSPREAMTFFEGTGHNLPASFASVLLANSQRDLLPLLLSRNAADFDVYLAGRNDHLVRLQINYRGQVSTLLIDAGTGKVDAIEWTGPSPAGYVKHHAAYSDYRVVSGLLLPSRIEVTLEGSDEPLPAGRSWTVTSLEINPAGIEARLRPALKMDGQ